MCKSLQELLKPRWGNSSLLLGSEHRPVFVWRKQQRLHGVLEINAADSKKGGKTALPHSGFPQWEKQSGCRQCTVTILPPLLRDAIEGYENTMLEEGSCFSAASPAGPNPSRGWEIC